MIRFNSANKLTVNYSFPFCVSRGTLRRKKKKQQSFIKRDFSKKKVQVSEKGDNMFEDYERLFSKSLIVVTDFNLFSHYIREMCLVEVFLLY